MCQKSHIDGVSNIKKEEKNMRKPKIIWEEVIDVEKYIDIFRKECSEFYDGYSDEEVNNPRPR